MRTWLEPPAGGAITRYVTVHDLLSLSDPAAHALLAMLSTWPATTATLPSFGCSPTTAGSSCCHRSSICASGRRAARVIWKAGGLESGGEVVPSAAEPCTVSRSPALEQVVKQRSNSPAFWACGGGGSRLCRCCWTCRLFVRPDADHPQAARPTVDAATDDAATHDPTSHAVAVQQPSPVELRAQLEQLLGQHAILTVRLTRARLRGDEDLAQSADEAFRGSTADIAASIGAVYGAEAAETFEQAWFQPRHVCVQLRPRGSR